MPTVSELKETLGKLLAHKGVPPFVLAANIMEPNYTSVRIWKEHGDIFVETVCTDEETGQPLKFFYRYTSDMTLQRIEMQVEDNRGVVWDRKKEIATLVLQIARQEREPLRVPAPVSEPLLVASAAK